MTLSKLTHTIDEECRTREASWKLAWVAFATSVLLCKTEVELGNFTFSAFKWNSYQRLSKKCQTMINSSAQNCILHSFNALKDHCCIRWVSIHFLLHCFMEKTKELKKHLHFSFLCGDFRPRIHRKEKWTFKKKQLKTLFLLNFRSRIFGQSINWLIAKHNVTKFGGKAWCWRFYFLGSIVCMHFELNIHKCWKFLELCRGNGKFGAEFPIQATSSPSTSTFYLLFLHTSFLLLVF